VTEPARSTLFVIRRMLLGVLAFGLAGTVSELWLIGHHEDWWQLVPLVMIGTSAVVLGWVAWSWTAGAVRVFRVCMLLLMLSGVTGSILHYRANMEFQLEMDPTLGGVALMFKVLHAKAPPTLAAGNMALLGLLGLVGVWRISDHQTTARS
jgi:hypothetical protein